LIGTGVWSWDPAYSGINVTDLSCNSDVCNVYVTDMIRGTYTFTWTVSNTFNGEYGMPSKTCILDAQIQIESKIVTPNAGDDQYVCSDTTTLSGSILDPLSDPWGTTGQWSVVVSPSAPSPPSFSSATTLVTTNNRNPKFIIFLELKRILFVGPSGTWMEVVRPLMIWRCIMVTFGCNYSGSGYYSTNSL
jgi:hypothetical protein